jgi:hypothetical protein
MVHERLTAPTADGDANLRKRRDFVSKDSRCLEDSQMARRTSPCTVQLLSIDIISNIGSYLCVWMAHIATEVAAFASDVA